jgi:hypothetical protein
MDKLTLKEYRAKIAKWEEQERRRKEYYARNRETIIARAKKWNAQNRSRRLANREKWNDNNAAYIAQYQDEYRNRTKPIATTD